MTLLLMHAASKNIIMRQNSSECVYLLGKKQMKLFSMRSDHSSIQKVALMLIYPLLFSFQENIDLQNMNPFFLFEGFWALKIYNYHQQYPFNIVPLKQHQLLLKKSSLSFKFHNEPKSQFHQQTLFISIPPSFINNNQALHPTITTSPRFFLHYYFNFPNIFTYFIEQYKVIVNLKRIPQKKSLIITKTSTFFEHLIFIHNFTEQFQYKNYPPLIPFNSLKQTQFVYKKMHPIIEIMIIPTETPREVEKKLTQDQIMKLMAILSPE